MRRQLAGRLAALGHEVRLHIVQELVAAHPAGLVASRLQRLTGVPASTLSHHLEALERQGLIARQREGRFQRYRASAPGLRAVLEVLTASCVTPVDGESPAATPAHTVPPLYD
jgi:DNA-binding transcriptional ArsR family regulator